MELDLYAGPLSRYYAGDWESVLDRAARETGAVYRQTDEPAAQSMEEIRAGIEAWLNALNNALAPNLYAPIAWNDDPAGDYATAQAGAGPYSALIAWSAYAQYAVDRPYYAPNDLASDPAVSRARASANPPALVRQLNCEIWLPGDFEFSAVIRIPTGEERAACSTGALRAALDEVNGFTWDADAATIAAWRRRGPPIARRLVEVAPGRFEPREAEPPQPAPETQFDHAAQYAFAVMFDLVRFAETHHAPLMVVR